METNAVKPPIGILFRCPGPHGSGCPDHAVHAFIIGLKAHEGLSFERIFEVFRAEGWELGAAIGEHPTAGQVGLVEPVCKRCAAKILSA